jgi:hypothetical protein
MFLDEKSSEPIVDETVDENEPEEIINEQERSSGDLVDEDADIFSSLFSKDASHELELFLNTFNIFAQKKSQLNALLKSLSSLKSPTAAAMMMLAGGGNNAANVLGASDDDTDYVDGQNEDVAATTQQQPVVEETTTTAATKTESLAELSNQVWSALLSQMDEEIASAGIVSAGGASNEDEDEQAEEAAAVAAMAEEEAAFSALLQRYTLNFHIIISK